MSIHNHGQYSMIASATKGPIGTLVFRHSRDVFEKGCKCQRLRYKILDDLIMHSESQKARERSSDVIKEPLDWKRPWRMRTGKGPLPVSSGW